MREMEKPRPTEQEDAIRQTGEWWLDPWWLRKDFFEVIPRSELQSLEAFEYLQEIFPASWAKQFDGELIENAFLRAVIYDRSAFQRAHLIRLSERLKRLREVRGVHRVIRALKGRKESDAADMELEFADYFFQKGYEIEFPIAKSKRGKSPDIRILSSQDSLAVECKSLRVAEATAWVQAAYNELTFELYSMAGARRLGLDFHFSERTMVTLLSERGSGADRIDSVSRWTKRLADELDLAVTKGIWPVFISLDGLGDGIFYPSPDGKGSTVRIPDIPDEILSRRILRNALIPAAQQLENGLDPGLIAVSVRDLPSDKYLSQEINQFFEQNSEKYGNVVGVLVIPWQPWFYDDPPRFVLNRSATRDWVSRWYSVMQELAPIVL